MTVSKEELSLLLATFDKADALWEAKKLEVEEAYKVRSDAVKAIATVVSPAKKIRYKGVELTIVCRDHKDGSGASWFFRGGSKKDDVLEIG
jgi:hypothetical protein